MVSFIFIFKTNQLHAGNIDVVIGKNKRIARISGERWKSILLVESCVWNIDSKQQRRRHHINGIAVTPYNMSDFDVLCGERDRAH